METARAVVSAPVLRKDFTIDEFHVIEAAAHGADAILLIAAILEVSEMRHFRELAASYRMAALVEVHDEPELDAAIDSGAEIIGVNNRNLHTFEVTLETSLRLAPKIPAGVVKVSESGIDSRVAVAELQNAGFHAFLVGEHLMKAADPSGGIAGLRSHDGKNLRNHTARRCGSGGSRGSVRAGFHLLSQEPALRRHPQQRHELGAGLGHLESGSVRGRNRGID